jgi:hypothetical protein
MFIDKQLKTRMGGMTPVPVRPRATHYQSEFKVKIEREMLAVHTEI